MNTTDKKQAFIMARAENKSLTDIAKELSISKTTCSKWNKELQQDIAELQKQEKITVLAEYCETSKLRRAETRELYQRLRESCMDIDFAEISPAKRLELFLKYADACKEDYFTETSSKLTDISIESIRMTLIDLANRVHQGTIPKTQAELEMSIYKELLSTYDKDVLQAKQLELEETLLSLQESNK